MFILKNGRTCKLNHGNKIIMRNTFLVFVVLTFVVPASAQQNLFTVSGGYVFANIKDVEASADGWRINGHYEHQPRVGKVHHGFSVGYIKVFTDQTDTSGSEIIESKYSIRTLPFYYCPKILIGEGSLQGFVSGAFGMQFSTLKRTGTLDDFETTDAGLYTGFGAGLRKTFNTSTFINLEYELAFSTNNYYNDGLIHTAMLGFGFAVK